VDRDPDQSETLIGRLKNGDQRALAELFSRHTEALKRMVGWRLDRRVRARVDPSDVLQEVYIDAARRVGDYLARPAMPFALWLRLLTGRRLLELHREHLGAQMRDARLEIPLEHGRWPTADLDCLATQLAGEESTPSQAAMRTEKETRLVEALGRMDTIDREVLVLRHFEELTNDEVACLLGIGKAAASNRYVRALERLGKILSGMSDLFLDKP
jgi:RNA polymerase sigma-70 factor (ECF subfamily)